MDGTITVALISFAGTLIGTISGILASSRLTNYRIEQLEKKVSKHNCIVERTYENELQIARIKEHISLKGEH